MSGNGFKPSQLRFGVFEVDLEAKEPRKSGIRIRLQPQPFEVLALLASRPGQIVSREELQQKLWAEDTFVDFDRSLNAAVKRLRIALNDDADTPRYIETIPRRGYRMIVPIIGVPSNASPAVQPVAPRLGTKSQRFSRGRIALIVGLLVILGIALRFGFRQFGKHPATRVMLAILPFEEFDPRTDTYFSDGLTEELISELGEVNPSSLGVIARTSAMHYKGSRQTVATIGRELGVDYVVEGSVRRQEKTARITVQLIRVSDQTHLWAHSYERSFDNPLMLEVELANAIAKEVSVGVPDAVALRARNEKRHATNAEAQELYLQGRYYWNKRYNESLKLSQSRFQQAIEIDPNYALAYSGLADADFVLAISGNSPTSEVMPLARAAALKAVQLDPDLPEAHISLAQVLSNYDWNWQEAEREYRRGIELNANNSTGHVWYATFLMNMSRFSEAIAELRRAQEVDPFSPVAGSFLGKAYYYKREYDKAIAQYQAVLRVEPGFPIASSFLVQAYEQAGKYEEAIAEYRRAIPLAGGDIKSAARFADELATAFRERGADGYWQTRLDSLSTPSPISKAVLYTRLGHSEEAFHALEQAYSEHDMWLAALRVDPQWDRVRNVPQFQTLVERVGLRY